MKKIQYYALRVFLTMMAACALIMLSLVWEKGPDGSFGIWNQLAISCFIIGLASFLTWITTVILEIKDRLGR